MLITYKLIMTDVWTGALRSVNLSKACLEIPSQRKIMNVEDIFLVQLDTGQSFIDMKDNKTTYTTSIKE